MNRYNIIYRTRTKRITSKNIDGEDEDDAIHRLRYVCDLGITILKVTKIEIEELPIKSIKDET